MRIIHWSDGANRRHFRADARRISSFSFPCDRGHPRDGCGAFGGRLSPSHALVHSRGLYHARARPHLRSDDAARGDRACMGAVHASSGDVAHVVRAHPPRDGERRELAAPSQDSRLDDHERTDPDRAVRHRRSDCRLSHARLPRPGPDCDSHAVHTGPGRPRTSRHVQRPPDPVATALSSRRLGACRRADRPGARHRMGGHANS